VMAAAAAEFRGQARLPRFAAPRRYELRLRPDLDACVFTGDASVVVDVSAPTRFLVLNAADLAVDRASIRFQGLAPTEVSLFEDDEILVLEFDGELPLGEGVLAMDFNGTLNDQMRGFYRSKYEYKGETKNMAVTQFEAVDARRCFPCWDEPAFKVNSYDSTTCSIIIIFLSRCLMQYVLTYHIYFFCCFPSSYLIFSGKVQVNT
jgi:puromycin-sensitive aminopeptidase